MDVSMVFGIIFTIIVMGALLVFGWDQIANLLGFGGEAQVLKTIDSLQKGVEYFYRMAEGSGVEFRLDFPKDYRLCFFNSSNPADSFYPEKSMTWDPDSTTRYLINASGYNVWYYRGEDDAGGQGKRIPYLDTPTEKNFCATGGKMVYIVNRGYSVEVEPM